MSRKDSQICPHGELFRLCVKCAAPRRAPPRPPGGSASSPSASSLPSSSSFGSSSPLDSGSNSNSGSIGGTPGSPSASMDGSRSRTTASEGLEIKLPTLNVNSDIVDGVTLPPPPTERFKPETDDDPPPPPSTSPPPSPSPIPPSALPKLFTSPPTSPNRPVSPQPQPKVSPQQPSKISPPPPSSNRAASPLPPARAASPIPPSQQQQQAMSRSQTPMPRIVPTLAKSQSSSTFPNNSSSASKTVPQSQTFSNQKSAPILPTTNRPYHERAISSMTKSSSQKKSRRPASHQRNPTAPSPSHKKQINNHATLPASLSIGSTLTPISAAISPVKTTTTTGRSGSNKGSKKKSSSGQGHRKQMSAVIKSPVPISNENEHEEGGLSNKDFGAHLIEPSALQDSCNKLFALTKILQDTKDPSGQKEIIRATIKIRLGGKHLQLRNPNEKDNKKGSKSSKSNNKSSSSLSTPGGSHTLILVHEKDPEPPKIKGMEWKFIGKTEWKPKNPDPTFETMFTIDFRTGSEVKLTVYDADGYGFFQEEIGNSTIPLANVLNYSGMETAYPLQHSDTERQMQLIEAQSAVVVLATVTKLDPLLDPLSGPKLRLSSDPAQLPLVVRRIEELFEDLRKQIDQSRADNKTLGDSCLALKRDMKHIEEEASRKNKMLETQVKSLLRYRDDVTAREEEMDMSASGKKKQSSISTSSISCPTCHSSKQEVNRIRKEIEKIQNSHVCSLCARELGKQYSRQEDDDDDM